MSISIPPRKGLKAKHLADSRPELPLDAIAKMVGTGRANVRKTVAQERFGRDKVKTRAPGA